MEELLTVEDVSKILKISISSLYRLVHLRQIPFIKVTNRCLRFSNSAIEKWIEEKKHAATPAPTYAPRRSQRRRRDGKVDKIIEKAKKEVS
jgi:excisionase family DNA binding protein